MARNNGKRRQKRWKSMEQHTAAKVRSTISKRLERLKSRVDKVADDLEENKIPLDYFPQGIETHIDRLGELIKKQLEQRLDLALYERQESQ